MSRIGLKPIEIPSGVKVTYQNGTVNVEGPVGKLHWTHRPEIQVTLDEGGKVIHVRRSDEERLSRSLHGLTRSIIANMVEGCAKGFSKELEIYGVGFTANVQGNTLNITCGLSHPAIFEIPAGITVDVAVNQARRDDAPARFTVKGADKQAVGELAARIRKTRPPEPYLGKGIRYAGERVRRKAGKAFAGAGSK
jgi:large subunit ribosomal protein L6